MTASVRVTAYMQSPVIGYDAHGGMLDGPLSWAWMERAKHRGIATPPLSATYCADAPLPLDTHGDTTTTVGWWWRVSRAHLDVARYTTVEQRKKPATDAMSRYARDKKHHLGVGPNKARDARVSAIWARSIWWDLDSTDTADLADLLGLVTHIGGKHSSGFGHVARWQIEPGLPGGWRDRPENSTHAVRAPYWHPTRRPGHAR